MKIRKREEERGLQAERALETFKTEVQRNSLKMYDDMKKQVRSDSVVQIFVFSCLLNTVHGKIPRMCLFLSWTRLRPT